MRARYVAAFAIAVAGIAAAPWSAEASVYYDVTYQSSSSQPSSTLEYKSGTFITSDTVVQASDPDVVQCKFTQPCKSIDFHPNDKFAVNTYDEINIAFQDGSGQYFDFKQGSFGSYGTYTDVNNGATLVVSSNPPSSVPLPSSAPLFGAALIALGSFGYSVKRRTRAA